jgi:hypothetical protein
MEIMPLPGSLLGGNQQACWAHLRRDFHDFWASTKSEIAREALHRIGNLYDLERDINGLPADARLSARQKLSQPKVAAFFTWSEQQLLLIPGKSDLAKAFRYGLSRQKAFSLFLTDGRGPSTTIPPSAHCARLGLAVRIGYLRRRIPAWKPSRAP